ncbi:MAG TPA: dCTP deaminase [Candidatus Nanoarchaeia archaeon]|nr:dCTP deaminase [Candidatus Nanoarchaeia archaeon]
MILTGSEIKKQVELKKIHINPFFTENLNPNSYNFRLGDKLKIYTKKILDSAKENKYREIKISNKGFVLQPNVLYLGHTVEEMGSDYYVPIMQARSSVGRLGLYIYLNSGLGDLGFKRQWTLELHAIHPLRVYPGMKVGQMLFWKPKGKIILYDGKYKNAKGPEASQIWKDFANR